MSECAKNWGDYKNYSWEGGGGEGVKIAWGYLLSSFCTFKDRSQLTLGPKNWGLNSQSKVILRDE